MCNRMLGLVIGFALMACQSDPISRFSQLKKGMDKGQVVDIIGSPKATSRYQGKDRWHYQLTSSQRVMDKELLFSDGKLVYAGNPVQPTVTAAEQDKINEKQNTEVQKLDASRGYGVTNSSTAPQSSGSASGAGAASSVSGTNQK